MTSTQEEQQYFDRIFAALKHDGWSLEYESDDVRNNKLVVLAAVKENGWALHYAGDALRNDRAIVLEAVKQNGWALQDASDALRNDRAIVLEAVKQSPRSIQYASRKIQDMVGDGDPVKAINSSLLREKLTQRLKPKAANQERGLKI